MEPIKTKTMERCDCSMQTIIGSKIYCGYYDAMYKKCGDIKYGFCPDGLDDEEEQDYECDHCDDMGCVFCEGY